MLHTASRSTALNQIALLFCMTFIGGRAGDRIFYGPYGSSRTLVDPRNSGAIPDMDNIWNGHDIC